MPESDDTDSPVILTDDPVFIWVIDKEPDTGSLHVYARAWARWRQGLGSRPSKTVLTWDDTSAPVTWNVTVRPLEFWDDGQRLYSVTVPGLHGEVHVLVSESEPDPA